MTGPFWDGVHGRAPIPPAAQTLGFAFISHDKESATTRVEFTAPHEFTNPAGNVLGAFLAAMLYDTVGPALLATLEPDRFQSTLDMNTSFLRPVRPGRIIGTGRVLHRRDDIAYLDAVLTAEDGSVIASATATARVIALEEARNAV